MRLKSLDGGWETVGVDRYPGIIPESLTYDWDSWGPSTCSFELKRKPGDIHPDLSAFTPCEVEVGSRIVWSGRVRETPTSADRIGVLGQGWADHGDDDHIRRAFLHSGLSAWQDVRDFAALDELEKIYDSGFEIGAEGGALMIRQSSRSEAGRYGGVVLDLGSSDAAGVYLEWIGGGSRWHVFLVEAAFSPTGRNGAFSAYPHGRTRTGSPPGYGLPGPTRADGTPLLNRSRLDFGGRLYRFVRLLLWFGGSNQTLGNVPDAWVMIRVAKVYRSTSYVTATGESALRAKDVLQACRTWTPLLSTADERLSETSFGIPHLVVQGTFRETAEAVNALHRYRLQVDEQRRVVFEPQPSRPLLELGEWGGHTFEDASANSADEIFDVVDVRYEDEFGQEATVRRLAAHAGYAAADAEPADVSFNKPTAALPGLEPMATWKTRSSGWGALSAPSTAAEAGFLLTPGSIVEGRVTETQNYVDPASTDRILPRDKAGVSFIWKMQRFLDTSMPSSRVRVTFMARTPATMTSQDGYFGCVARRRPGEPRLAGFWIDGRLEIYKVLGGVSTRLAQSAIVNLPASANRYIRFTAEETLTLELFDVDPAVGSPTPLASLSHTLSPADEAAIGIHVSGAAGIQWAPPAAGWSYGNYRHERRRLTRWSATSLSASTPQSPDPGAVLDGTRKETGDYSVALQPRIDRTWLGGADDTLVAFPEGAPTYRRGRTYRFAVRVWSEVACAAEIGRDPSGLSIGRASAVSGWQDIVVFWRPERDYAGADAPLMVYPLARSSGLWVDRITVEVVVVSLPDRRGFNRTFQLTADAPLNRQAAEIIGDMFMRERRSTPLRGTLAVSVSGAREVLGGRAVDPSDLGRYVNHLIRLSNRVDPDTGGWGRDARIVAASYDSSTREARLSLDNRRDDFEALLRRMGALTS